jgi:hypothetical protein
VRIGERLPGTTEVLESCFGKLKGLEDGQSKSGFTGLVLSLGAIVSKRTIETIGEALERCRVRDVWDWCREKLGVSVQSLRKQAYTQYRSSKEKKTAFAAILGEIANPGIQTGQLFTSPIPSTNGIALRPGPALNRIRCSHRTIPARTRRM